jgi:serine/threonine-protein kinase
LSPEQARGEGVVDGRSDLFAIGIVLFELLTGRRPFEAKNPVATAYRIVHEPAPRLASFGVDVDPELEAALDLALAKAPADRYASAEAFAEAIARFAGDAPEELLGALLDVVLAVSTRTSGIERKEEASPLAPTELVLHTPPKPTASSRLVSQPSSASRIPVVPSSSPRIPVASPSQTPTTALTFASRPLPQHVKGRCHVRGTLPRAVFRWLERAYGRDALEPVLAAIPSDVAMAFRSDAFNALVWHDLEPLDTFIEAATTILLERDAVRWRRLARENFAHDLATILRPSARLVDVVKLCERAATGWARIFDFGKVVVVPIESGRSSIQVFGFDAVSLALRYAFVGTMDGLLESGAVPGAAIRIVVGESNFARDLDLEVTWSA